MENQKNNEKNKIEYNKIEYKDKGLPHTQDLEESNELEISEELENKNSGFFIKMIALFIAISIILFFVIPSTIFEPENKPVRIPSLEELNNQGLLKNLNLSTVDNTGNTLEQLITYRSKTYPEIKVIADYIASKACPYKDGNNELCYAKALYYFVRDNIQYIPDPSKTEFIEPPQITLKSGSADCDGFAVLLSSLYHHVGIDSRYVIIKNHVFIEAKLKKSSKYDNKEGYIPLDPTCKDCEFGTLPSSVKIEPIVKV
ncbi:MAG: hypothetical protein PWP03_515 [Candidatus Woesearchaeota archaeon]|nr:hypothetical protein [Candidatus Woesearchaeota archaeon]MDN5327877.1 hypothetical protein [Candidatus Woesearchaeota archaeon]